MILRKLCKFLTSTNVLTLAICICLFSNGALAGRRKPPVIEEVDDDDSEAETIETVKGDKLNELLEQQDQNLFLVFFDLPSKCPSCQDAIDVLEEIDDDLEASGYIQVVKTNDKHVARDYGVRIVPSAIYFRRANPILYDGDFDDAIDVMRWVRSHEEVVTINLNDKNFEDRTDSFEPDAGALDWFVMFYRENDPSCSSHEAVWETVAHRLRGIINVGAVDIGESDDVADRFGIDGDDECPSMTLFKKGKMYKYKDSAFDDDSLVSFAQQRYKEQRSYKVPDPPTKIEELFEELKEDIGTHAILLAVLFGLVGAGFLGFKGYKRFKAKPTVEEPVKED